MVQIPTWIKLSQRTDQNIEPLQTRLVVTLDLQCLLRSRNPTAALGLNYSPNITDLMFICYGVL